MRWSRVAAVVLIVFFPTPALVLAGAAKKTITWGYPQFGVDAYGLTWNGVMDAVGGAIQKVWHGEARVAAALAEAEKLPNQAIAEAAK